MSESPTEEDPFSSHERFVTRLNDSEIFIEVTGQQNQEIDNAEVLPEVVYEQNYPVQSEQPNENRPAKCCKKTRLFTQYAVKDIGRNQCNFCLAFCSVLVVVLSILVVNTIVQMGPLVFLSSAEAEQGQIDAIFAPASPGAYSNYDYYAYSSQGEFFNYTQVNELYGAQYNFSPRKQFQSVFIHPNVTSYNDSQSNDTVSYLNQSCRLTLIDTEQEKKIDLGIGYPFKPLSTGECLVSSDWQSAYNISIGSVILLGIEIQYTNETIMQLYNNAALINNWPLYTNMTNYTLANCTVVGLMTGTYGKYPNNEASQTVIMEYDNFLSWIQSYIQGSNPPQEFNSFMTQNSNLLQEYADFLMYTLPQPRFQWYQPSNFQTIQNEITKITNQLSLNLGFYEPRVLMSLLKTIQLTSTTSLLLGLLFGIIIMLFVVISILLIYSLLMISVETKTFENGVLRLVGVTKLNCIIMILIQSFLFVLPSVIFGYILSIPTLAVIYSLLFKNNSEIHISPVPSAGATLQALFLGLLIPIISSILPIQASMSKTLCDSLNATRSKTKGAVVKIETSNSFSHKIPFILFGSLATLYGVIIFFFLPLAILNTNLSLLFNVFLLMLVGMILGLSMVSFNLQKIFEILVLHTLLFFEKRSMKLLIFKNLSAHRASNKMTSIIYSLTLGCIIFIVVAANLQIQMSDHFYLGNINYQIFNTEECIKPCMTPTQIDQILLQFSDSIENFGYVSSSYYDLTGDESTASPIYDPNQQNQIKLMGISPSQLLDLPMNLDYQNQSTTIGPTTQLYTATGSQCHGYQTKLLGDTNHPKSDLSLICLDNFFLGSDGENKSVCLKQRQLFSWNDVGYFGDDSNFVLVSLPMISQFQNQSISNLSLEQVNIQFKSDTTASMISQFEGNITNATKLNITTTNSITNSTTNITTNYTESKIIEQVIFIRINRPSSDKEIAILNNVFNTIIAITMFLCFFALSANMSANLYHQQKEVAVLRSIGLTKIRIKLLYFYEAIVLVFSSCLMGLMIGLVVGYTICLLQALVLGFTLYIVFPTTQFIVVVVLSVICAFFSTYGPTTHLLNKQISAIFRMA